MSEDEHEESPLERSDQEIGAEIADDPEALIGALPHYYRGEVTQSTTSQDRIDQTTNWAITVLAAILSVVFSSPDMPAYLLLVGILVLSVFLSFEVRRYRFYDMYRSRVRFFQENVFANALQPVGVEHAHWREELSEDLRYPTFKVTAWEALSRRLSRIYILLFVVLGVSWIAKVTLFTPETQWTEAAELPGVHGLIVAATLGVFYLGICIIAWWPHSRRAKGEVYGEEPGEWKDE
ncbi:DUF2270 domain-containing protein [Natronorubrum daqingense]|uniref:Uncharacterized membrane protein n=1 Tax=Natronorubrum daqingense TaxID=588898 RepID=A0A1N7BZR5_9EURY|nr:DUF2270 domain-containing protein [Natronorubrum daqingense]APX96670.1 hypothetical protein BB347_08610 [Natronorubrum daqingense]SIR56829.1 Uncharacterized membrane protein [Natronorubrum daqingense]